MVASPTMNVTQRQKDARPFPIYAAEEKESHKRPNFINTLPHSIVKTSHLWGLSTTRDQTLIDLGPCPS